MGDVVFFKNPQVKDDLWSEIERGLTGMFVLHGFQREILSPLIARSRSVWDRFWAEKIQMSFTVKLLPALTPDQEEALKKQLEDAIQQSYQSSLTRLLALVMQQLAEMESELYWLRKEAGE